ADRFAVGTLDEAVELREAGIQKPILILLGLLDGDPELLFEHHLTPVVYDLQTAQRLNLLAEKKKKILPIHLKIDTGMTRLGITPQDWPDFLKEFKNCPFLQVEGVLSHLAEAGDDDYTEFQRTHFEKMVSQLKEAGIKPAWFHLSNSIESLQPNKKGNLVRLGIVLYGALPIRPLPQEVSLKPVMTVKTKIVSLKKVSAGTCVSYNRIFKTKRESRIGVLPIGYADGYPRLLSNKADLLVRGKRVPVLGTVCMDMMMIDLTDFPEVAVGEEVVVLGRQGDEEIRAEELAEKAQTIAYEIFTNFSTRLRREYIKT
ncbi:MAG: alanine racemase, partial [bacterium]|nr:alanine racemase [bacterium]